MSLTTPPQTNARGLAQTNSSVTEEEFLKLIDSELTKVEKFTLERVQELREKITEAEHAMGNEDKEKTKDRADRIAEDFLRLEKYVVR